MLSRATLPPPCLQTNLRSFGSERPYPSDITDDERSLAAPFPTLLSKCASQQMQHPRELFNGLCYVVRCDIAWPAMPHDLPS